jgi:2-oxoisovalerate dehydrogenase E1 component
MKPVVEIQFFDYIWPAMHQIRNELALMRWRSNGEWASPAVIRVPIGGYLTGGSIYHSQSGESIFTHIPGCAWSFPRTRWTPTACCAPPSAATTRCSVSRAQAALPRDLRPRAVSGAGVCHSVRQGQDRSSRARHITLVTYGALVPAPCRPPKKAQREHGIEVEILDLRTLNPYDWEAIATSVRKTSRVIVAHEDMISWGYGAEIAARIADELFDDPRRARPPHRRHGYLCRLPAAA